MTQQQNGGSDQELKPASKKDPKPRKVQPMVDRLIEDKVYLSILANNFPRRLDVSDDVTRRNVSVAAGDNSCFEFMSLAVRE